MVWVLLWLGQGLKFAVLKFEVFGLQASQGGGF